MKWSSYRCIRYRESALGGSRLGELSCQTRGLPRSQRQPRVSVYLLGSLQNLNFDLHSLSRLGVAVGQADGNGNGGGAVKKLK
jgi:hypothetical protein